MEISILFSTPMVQAILANIKRMTRRTRGLDEINERPDEWMFDGLHAEQHFQFLNKITGRHIILKCPYGKPGDILWVRETWRDRWGMAYANYGTGNAYPIDDVREIEYKAGGNGFFMHGCNLCPDEPTVKWGEWSKWRPSIHMPREAARIFLKVTNVRVERLQDITEGDAKAEGIMDGGCLNCGEHEPCGCENPKPDYRDAFAYLWDSLNAERGYGWDKNPWVWVVEFERQ